MAIIHDVFKKEIAQLISAEIFKISQDLGQEYILQDKDIISLLSVPPNFSLGQAALPCFPFAKQLKLAPNKIAEMLSNSINKKNKLFVSEAKNVNAYLNFFMNFENSFKLSLENLEKNKSFSQDFLEPHEKEKIVVEYSQPNTHKAMHVGHLRCLVLGDAVCNLLDYAGHTAVRATYPGDIGTHVAKIIWYLTHPTPKKLPIQDKASWLGQMYAKADETLKSFQGTEEESKIKKDIAEILAQISKKSGPYYDLWKETREWSLEYLKGIYTWLNSHFDVWYFESECDEPSKELVLKKYKEGFFIKDNGAIGIDLSQWKLGFAMYLKSDGNGLYQTKDLDLISKKFADPAVTKSICVVDARQKFHFDQLFKTAELMGYPQAAKSIHLSYETVNTEQGTPFSSRELNGLGLLELKEKMEEKVTSEYLERYRNNWSDEEIKETAKNVTIGALKYGMLRVDNNTQIHFSLTEWLRLDGETGPYLQYVHARCASILQKIGLYNTTFKASFIEKEEQQLYFLISRFNDFALQASSQCRPSILANYLYDVAKNFNRFYEACSIRDSEGDCRDTRLALVFMTKSVIYHGLKLLGIPALEKM
jgi:arginyl-tRNA synthetase